MARKRTVEDILIDTFAYILAFFIFIVTFYPFILALILSFNEGRDAENGGIYFWPRKPTIENYMEFFTDMRWIVATFVTFARTIVGTLVAILVTCMAGYAMSFKKLVGRKIYMSILIFAMYFGGGLIPYYLVLRWTGMLDKFIVYIIPGAFSIWWCLVSITFFRGIPSEMHESAVIDGANDLTIMVRIIFPVSLPLLATIAIFTAVGHWNSWFDSAFFVKNENLRTLGYQMMTVINRGYTIGRGAADRPGADQRVQTITTRAVQLAAMIIAVAPIIAVYPSLQKYFMTGLTLGSVKG